MSDSKLGPGRASTVVTPLAANPDSDAISRALKVSEALNVDRVAYRSPSIGLVCEGMYAISAGVSSRVASRRLSRNEILRRVRVRIHWDASEIGPIDYELGLALFDQPPATAAAFSLGRQLVGSNKAGSTNRLCGMWPGVEYTEWHTFELNFRPDGSWSICGVEFEAASLGDNDVWVFFDIEAIQDV